MSDDFTPQPGAVDGQPLSSVADEEWRSIEQAYKEIQRRDDRAEYRAWRRERFALTLLVVVVLMLGWNLWLWLDYRKVQAFVQVVQVDNKGTLVQMGIPQELLAYQPPDGVWIDMLGEWVRRWRWRGTDPVLAKAQWAWLYRHTCGEARRLLHKLEDKEQPFKPGKKLTAVELKSITKTAAPEGYQVLWSET